MDSTTGGTLGIFGFLISAVGIVYTAINHKRLRCKCCGKNMDISVDVEPTTPPEEDKEKDADKGKDKDEEEEVEVKPIERIRYKSPPKMAAAGLGLTRK
jgi:hypothetical protein